MLFQYILGELGIEALAYAQNSPFVRSFNKRTQRKRNFDYKGNLPPPTKRIDAGALEYKRLFGRSDTAWLVTI